MNLRLLFIFLFGIQIAFAQQVEFEQLTIRNGLPDNTIVAVTQDKKGFIWIATQGAISRYNGFDIETWMSSDSSLRGPLSNKITCIAADTIRNCLYIGYYAGFSVFDLEKERFTHYSSQLQKPSLLPDEFIRTIVVDAHNRVWIGTERAGLCEFLPEEKKIRRLSSYVPVSDHGRITALSVDPNGKLWIAGQSNVLLRLNPEMGSIDSIKLQTTASIDTPINRGIRLLCDNSNRLWIGTEEDGVYVYDVKIRTFIKHYAVGNSDLKSNHITQLYQDNYGAVWIGTDKGGIARWKNDSIQVYKHSDSNNKTLSSNIVSSLFESKDGCLWVGTYNGGLSVFKRYKRKFLWVGGLSSNVLLPTADRSVLSFAESNGSDVWVGLDGGGLLKFNYDSRKISCVEHPQMPKVVKSLCSERSGKLWIGSYGQGLWMLHNNQLQQIKFSNNPILDSRSSIWALHKDSYGYLWIGALNNGIYCLPPNGLKAEHLRQGEEVSLLSNNNVLCFYEDSKQNLWIGTDGRGLDLFNRENKKFIKYPLLSSADKAKTISVTAITEDKNGSLWIGSTQKGLYKLYDIKNKKIVHYGREWGVPQSDIVSLQVDIDNVLWICTKSNIYQFNERDSTCKVFDVDDGLQQSQFSTAASFSSYSGILFFGGVDGFNTLDTKHIDYQTHAPQVAITSFELFNQALSPNESVLSKQYLSKSITYTDTIELSSAEYSFAINFAALDYTLPQSNEYQYLLEGYDKQWISCRGNNHRAIYSNLPSGTYTFWVRAANCDNVWGTLPAQLTIIINHPWWLRWWWWCIVVAVVAIVIISIKFALKRQKKQSAKELEIAVEERNKTLIERNSEFQARVELLEQSNHTKERLLALIGQDLKNPFNVLINFSGLLVKEYETVPEDKRPRIFAAIHQSSTSIYNMMTNLLDWARSQTGDLQYNPQPINLYTLVDSCFAMFSTSADHKHLTLTNDTSPDIQVFADEEMIKTVFRNLISNSIKYSFENGTIRITTRQSSHEYVEISVIDEGMGISKEHAERLFSLEHGSFYAQHGKEHGTGLGLLICKEFLEQHGSIIKVDSVLHKGSTVIFYLQIVNIP